MLRRELYGNYLDGSCKQDEPKETCYEGKSTQEVNLYKVFITKKEFKCTGCPK